MCSASAISASSCSPLVLRKLRIEAVIGGIPARRFEGDRVVCATDYWGARLMLRERGFVTATLGKNPLDFHLFVCVFRLNSPVPTVSLRHFRMSWRAGFEALLPASFRIGGWGGAADCACRAAGSNGLPLTVNCPFLNSSFDLTIAPSR